MTTRFSGLVVVLESDLREDHAQPLIDAIAQLRGVAHVYGCESGLEQHTRAMQVRMSIAKPGQAAESELSALRARVAELEQENAQIRERDCEHNDALVEYEKRLASLELPEGWLAEQLRQSGYLVLSPSDTSPVAELVRAAFRFNWAGSRLTEPMRTEGLECPTREAESLADAADQAASDPAVRAWVERGRR